MDGENPRSDVVVRLRKVEGQIRGLQKMVEEGKETDEVIPQLLAARKALDKAGFLLISTHLHAAIRDNTKEGKKGVKADDKSVDEAIKRFLSMA